MTRCLSWIIVLSIIAIVGSRVRIVPIPYFYRYNVRPRGGMQGEFGQDPGIFPFIDPDQEPPMINPIVPTIAAIAVIAAAVPMMQAMMVPPSITTTTISTTSTVAPTTTTTVTAPIGMLGESGQSPATGPCQPNPCLNGGQCRSSGGVFVGCNCMPTFCSTLCNCNLFAATGACICP